MKILVCTDGSEHSTKAIKETIRIAKNALAIDISVLNVQSKVTTPLHTDDTEKKLLSDRFAKQNETKSRAILEEAKRLFDAEGLPVSLIAKEGHKSNTILEEAISGKYDMVILGSRGISGPKKLLLGSVSNAVVQEAKFNVLIVKA